MVQRDDILSSPATGETFRFLKTAADTNGRLLEFEMHIQPGGAKALPQHIHPNQEERIEVLKGALTFFVGRETRVLKAGDAVVVPSGTPHHFENNSDDACLLLYEIEPAGQWETLFETLCATSRNPRIVQNGQLNPLALAVTLDKYQDHLYMAGIPVFLQKLMFRALAVIERLQGFQAEYSYVDSVPEAEREVSILLV